MLPIPINFPLKERSDKCVCVQEEDKIHLYRYKSWNNEPEIIPYERIYSENTDQIRTVYIRFTNVFEKRENYIDVKEILNKKENMKNSPHVIRSCDPLSSVYILKHF